MSRLKKNAGDVVKFPNSYYPQHESIQAMNEYRKVLEDITSISVNRYYEVEKYIKSLDISNDYYDEIYGSLDEMRKVFNDLENSSLHATELIEELESSLQKMSENSNQE